MDPVTAILSAASLAGAIIGGQRKHIDPAWLQANYGAHAVTQEAQQLFERMVNSPTGQQIVEQANATGQRFAANTNAQAAAAGMTPSSGAATGTGIFATGAAAGASDSLVNQGRANLYSSVLPVAQDIVNQRRDAYMQDFYNNGAPTQAANQWSRIGNAAGIALSAAGTAKPNGSNVSTGVPNATPIAGTQRAVTSGPGTGLSVGPMMSVPPLSRPQPQYSFMQKSRRLMGSLGSRFVNAFQPQQQQQMGY